MPRRDDRPPNLPRVAGLVQMTLSVWDSERGDWLHTRGSVIRGGRHLPFTGIDDSAASLEAKLNVELRGAIRSLQHGWLNR